MPNLTLVVLYALIFFISVVAVFVVWSWFDVQRARRQYHDQQHYDEIKREDEKWEKFHEEVIRIEREQRRHYPSP